MMHQMFAFKNLEKGEDLMALRHEISYGSSEMTFNQTFYDPVSIIENYATNPRPSINSNPISTNNNIVEVMNYPNNLAIWTNFHKTMGWNGTSTEEILGEGYYTDDASIVNDFSSNFNMDGSFQGQKPHSLGVDIKVSSGQVENITFYYYFMYGATKMCYLIPFYNFGKANVKVLDMIYDTYHTIQD